MEGDIGDGSGGGGGGGGVCVIIYHPAAEATAVAVSIYPFPWPRTGLAGHDGTPNRHNERTKENRTQKGCAPRKERKQRKDETDTF